MKSYCDLFFSVVCVIFIQRIEVYDIKIERTPSKLLEISQSAKKPKNFAKTKKKRVQKFANIGK